MRVAYTGLALGAALLILGVSTEASLFGDRGGAALSPAATVRLLGGAPTCLSEGSGPRVCAGVGCGAATVCSDALGHPGGCIKIVLASYNECKGKGSLDNHNCSAKSLTTNCGSISYGTHDEKRERCLLGSCTGGADPCGEARVETTVTPCEQ